MKRLILAPLFLTLLIGCGATDKTFKERRDDCADFEGQIISREDFMDKYKIGSNRHWEWQYEGKDGYTRVRKFCQFYK